MNSFKKIALGLAAAMSFGVMSALPTSAAVIAPTLTIDSATDSIIVGETATAVVSLSYISETSADTATVLSAMFSQPSTANKSATLTLLETNTATVAIAGDSLTANVNSTVNTAGYVTAKFTVTLTERILQPETFQVNLQLCKTDFRSDWDAIQMGYSAFDVLPKSFADFLIIHR